MYQQSPIYTASELDKSWLAGFIDGEGYVGITFQRKRETNHSAASPRYHPYLIIANANEDALLHIQKLVSDGRLYRMHSVSENNKAAYQYKLTKKDSLLAVLQSILPYLRVKRQQCELLIDFIRRRQNIRPRTGRGTRGLSSYTAEDEKIYKDLLFLNKRGN